MDFKERNIKIAEAIDKATSIAVMPSKVAGPDAFCAAAGLLQMLKAREKRVTLIYQGNLPEGYEDLVDKSYAKNEVSSRELMVSIDYSNIPDATAQYSNVNNVLYIKLSPITKDFEVSRVNAHISGEEYDLVFMIGAQVIEDYGQIFRDMEPMLYKSTVVNVDHTERNTNFGNLNVVDASESSLSLLVLNVSRFWRLKINEKSALALLKGITYRKV